MQGVYKRVLKNGNLQGYLIKWEYPDKCVKTFASGIGHIEENNINNHYYLLRKGIIICGSL